MLSLDDNDRNTVDMIVMFKDTPFSTLILTKCNLQDRRVQNAAFKNAVNFIIRDSFIKFWVQYEVACENLQITKSTIVYGKGNVPGLSKCKSFTIRASFVKNPEFVYRPLSDAIRELRVTENDFYGVMKFNMVYFVCVFPDKFKNLRVLDFHGDVEEPTLIQLLVNIKLYPDLKEITLCNKSSFFDVK